jgi:hypothetical protein
MVVRAGLRSRLMKRFLQVLETNLMEKYKLIRPAHVIIRNYSLFNDSDIIRRIKINGMLWAEKKKKL